MNVKAVDEAYRLVRIRQLGMAPRAANATKGQHQYIHKRLLDDNEGTRCGSREGAASLDDNEVNCPRCRALGSKEGSP